MKTSSCCDNWFFNILVSLYIGFSVDYINGLYAEINDRGLH